MKPNVETEVSRRIALEDIALANIVDGILRKYPGTAGHYRGPNPRAPLTNERVRAILDVKHAHSATYDNRRRYRRPLPGCDCMQCFGYCCQSKEV